jgi:hypothetical protein
MSEGLDDYAEEADGPLDPFVMPIGPDDLVLQSEFGGVVLSKDVSANGERLRVLGMTSGVEIFLDPLELERIAVAGHDTIALLVSPEPLTTEVLDAVRSKSRSAIGGTVRDGQSPG